MGTAPPRLKWTHLPCGRCVDNFFSVIAGLLEFFACISLRYTQPDLPRPFRIPGPRWALVVGLAPAIFLGFAVASATAFQTPLTGGLCALGVVIGMLFSIVPRATRLWTARAYAGHGEHLPVADPKDGARVGSSSGS